MSIAKKVRSVASVALLGLFGFLSPFVRSESVWSNLSVENPYDSVTGSWTDPGNWTTSEAPVGEDAVAVFGPVDSMPVRVVATTEVGSLPLVVGTVSGGSFRHVIQHPSPNGLAQPGGVLALLNPDAFAGFWCAGDAKAVFELRATAERKPVLQNLGSAYRPEVNVATAGATARVGWLGERGALIKSGAGELEIGTTGGPDQLVYVDEGKVSFDASNLPTDAEVDALLESAYLHLDASVDATLSKTTLPGWEGRTFVTNWADVRGGSRPGAWFPAGETCSESPYEPVNPPFVAGKTQAGRTLVDFGSRYDSDVDTLGPKYCVMKFTKSEQVREVFMAMERSDANGYCSFIGAEPGTIGFIAPPSAAAFVGLSSQPTILRADYVVNGFRLPNFDSANPTGPDWRSFHVFSIGMDADIPVSYLATDRLKSTEIGGVRIGEVILFTRSLTRQERAAITRRLQAKWTGAAAVANCDLGALKLADGSETVRVGEGGRFTVRDVRSVSGRLVKEGAGTLAVGNFIPAVSEVQVNDGAVAFAATAAVSTNAPATDPYIWLDASKRDSLVEEDGAAGHVAQWKDCRDNGVVAMGYGPYVRPVLIDDADGQGHPAVSFGEKADNSQSAVLFPDWDSPQESSYAGFLVCKMVGEDCGNAIFGSRDMTMRCGGAWRILNFENYFQKRPLAALWTVNGRMVDPISEEIPEFRKENPGFFVLAFSSPMAICCNAIAKLRDTVSYSDDAGGIKVMEALVYHRPISDAERRNTEAYLMARWLGMTHPAAIKDVPPLNFAADKPVVIENDCAMTVKDVTGGNGTFVKAGSGALTLDENAPVLAGLSSLSVEAGSLVVPASDPLRDVYAAASFHFDALDAASLTTNVVGAGEDARTDVAAWRDVRNNGVVATPVIEDINVGSSITFANPTLRMAETASGVYRPVVDFGVLSRDSGIDFHSPDSAGMSFTPFRKLREVHIIYSGQPDVHGRPGCYLGSDGTYLARTDEGLLRTGTAEVDLVRNGYVAMDGIEVSPDTHVTARQFNLFSFAPVGDVEARLFARDRAAHGGGCAIGEVIAFDSALDPAVRAQLQASLMKKWFDVGSGIQVTNEYASVAVAPGAALAFGSGVVVKANALSVGGDLTADVVLTTSLQTEMITADSWKCSTVNGRLSFDAGAEIVVAGQLGVKAVPGDYVIASATGGIEGFENARCVIQGMPSCRTATVLCQGDDLVLRIEKTGFALIVR